MTAKAVKLSEIVEILNRVLPENVTASEAPEGGAINIVATDITEELQANEAFVNIEYLENGNSLYALRVDYVLSEDEDRHIQDNYESIEFRSDSPSIIAGFIIGILAQALTNGEGNTDQFRRKFIAA